MTTFAASVHQERLWFVEEIEGGAYHNVPLVAHCAGEVDLDELQHALDALVGAHEALRTGIRPEGDALHQEIASQARVMLQVVPVLSIDEELARPFDLSRPPLLRATYATETRTLLLVAHQSVVDRPSLRLMFRALAEGVAAPELHYIDHSEWLRAIPESEIQELFLHWQYQLRDKPNGIELPAAHPRQAVQPYRSGTAIRRFSSSLDEKIERFGATHGASRANILYSAFVALLYRYSRQEDIVVGTSIDLRGPETRQTVGPLSNLVALRSRAGADDTAADLVSRNAVMLDAAKAHAAIPYEKVAQLLGVPSLFDVVFNVTDAPPLELGAWRYEDVNRGFGNYDLNVLISRDGDGLVCDVNFNAELHEQPFVEQLARHYERMLDALLDGQRVDDVDLLATDERRLLLETWASRPASYPAGVAIHELFEEQVRMGPDRIAVTAGDERVTYRELNERANRIAHWLLARGVQRQQLIAVHVEPSIDIVVCILGILKAGCAYLPLDVKAPAQRIAYQLSDSACALLLTSNETVDFGIEGVVALREIHSELTSNPSLPTSPTDLAYCIYTSGSTGMPKGVLVEHVHVVRLMKNGDFDFDFSERDVWTVFHNFNFDFSVWEMYGALLYGGRVVIVPEEAKHNPAQFLALLEREQVTVLNQTPSAFYRLAEYAGDASLALRWVIFGGESLDPTRLRAWRERYPSTVLVNGYGITETTVFSTFQPVTGEMFAHSAGIIGRPIATTSVYVLDDRLRPVPAGVPGQIFIGGLGVARGYLNRPDLTADRFIPSPFPELEETRLYKSGDVARWLPDGRLEFLGRRDNQVQLRGLRIELGEIESQLVRQEGVKQAVVIVREDGHGEKYLAAYLVVPAAEARQELTVRYRQALQSVLPPYMVPSAFVFIDTLPLTPNGKLDKAALPDPDMQSQAVYVAPETEAETKLAAIWQEILKLREQAGVTADFFSLGGHSLLAMRTVSAINAAFDANLPVKALFEHNTIRALAAHLGQHASSGYALIPRASRDEALPLSFAQQRLWFIDRLEEGSAQYNMPMALRLTGHLNVDALQRSLDEIVARHEVIRSTYHLRDGAGVQVVHPPKPVAIGRISGFDEAMLREEAARPFDLERDLMLRVQLAVLAPEEHILLFTMHHIASDGWSLGVLVKEFVELYEAHCLGIDVALAPLPIQYADYAAWQRNKMQGAELAGQLAYWKKQLARLPSLHSLPLDRPRPAQQQFAGGSRVTRIGNDTLAALNRLAAESRSTLFMLLETAFALLLSRWSGASDVVVGTPSAGRNHKDTEPLIGFFVNTLVLRNELSADASFAELLRNGRQMVLDAFSNQDVPFEMLVDELQPERSLSHSPIYQIVFALQNNEHVALRLPDLEVAGVDGGYEIAKFDLSLAASELAGGLTLTWNYACSLFDAETIERLAASFGVLLEGIAAAPETAAGLLPIVTPAEEELLRSRVAEAREFPATSCLHELFERQVAETPEAVAVAFEGESLTYRALNERANQVAHGLIDRGVGPDVLVGLRVERSLEMVAGILGILKAGGAYLPLDPDYPAARLQYMVDDAGVDIVLTRQEISSADGPRGNPSSRALPSNLAYVIYTSGSTGNPKGVMIEHRNVTRLMDAADLRFEFGPGDVWTLFHSYAFDFSVWELWGALLYGGRLVVVPFETTRSAERFYELLQREQVTVLNQTPSAFYGLTDVSLGRDRLSALRYVIFGGEALVPSRLRAWAGAYGDDQPRLINMYGITETTVHVTYRRILAADCQSDVSDIGAPLADLVAYVGSHGSLVPAGVPGELYVGGAGVARGYLGKPELTETRFLRNPFIAGRDERLYRTGDLVRYRPDGNLEYLGRIDEQVKIRGFRIELGEIASQLLRQAEVKEALVLVHDKRLVAYVVPATAGDDVVLIEAIKGRLKQQLPDYMVPAAFVVMEAFPLTGNGKIDRKALPEPDWQATTSYTAPRTEVEAQLAAIWAQLLKLDRVGVDDNFFAIGGDSILSIQAVSRANQAGIAITTRQLFENQTIAALAAQASHGVCQETPQEAVTGSLSLLPIQRQFLAEDEVERHHFNQSLLLETPEGFDARFLREVVAALLNRHDALRLRFTESGAEHQELTAEMIAASAIVEPAAADVTARCTHWQQSFDLAKGPLFRAVYFESGRLFLVAHHIVVDGVSWRILLADIEQAFRQYQGGEPIVLAPKTSSFQQWGAALAEYVETLTERAYWLSQHETAPLPVDHVVERPTYSSSRRARVRLHTDETQALLQKCAPVYRTTINELLLSGLYLGMRRWTKAADLRIALEGHGRESLFEQLDTTQTVGWFTTMFPLTLHSESANVAEVIKSVKEQYRALPNGGIGYGLLRYVVQDEAIAAQELPQLVFNYLGQFDQSVNRDTALQGAVESAGPSISGERRRPYRLGLNGGVANGSLDLALDYSALEYDDATIAALAAHIERGLRDVIEHCLATGHGDFTTSDFPLAAVSQATLDAWQTAYPSLAKLYPATPMQQGLFFHSQLDRSAYVTQIYPTFEGELAAEHLRRAWEIVTNRHDIFRTAFVGEDARLHQLVVNDVELPWQEHDWRGLSAGEQRERFAKFREQDKAQGFDFARPPLQRLTLFQLAEDRWQLLWTHHHTLLDGWCTPLVYKEVMLAYHRLSRGEAVQFGEAPRYEKYIQWLGGRDAAEARQYWREALKDVEAPTPLGIDKLPKDSAAGTRERTLTLGTAETRRLEAFAREHHTTVNTLMQLAWGYLLHRYSGEAQVTFGAITSGRPAEVPGIEEMIGLFINTIPVKVAFAPGATTADLLADLHRAFQHGQEQSFLPLNEIQKQSAVAPGTPLFDSLLVFENYPIEAAMAVDSESGSSSLRVTGSASDEATNYKISLIAGLAGQLKVRCLYRGEEFAEQTIARLLAHLEIVLGGLTERGSIGDVDVVTPAENEQYALWNRTAEVYPREACIHELFERQSARTPDAVAVVFGDTQMTYAELDARAKALAQVLVEKNVGADTLVGVYADRSLEMVVALLAILKAGGAYVPLDPSYPPARLQGMIEDANARIVLTQAPLAGALDGMACEVIVLPSGRETLSTVQTLPEQPRRVSSTNLAYVMYTSGSAGRPKGVMVEHRSVVRLVINNHHVPLNAQTRVLQASSCSFDVATLEIWGSLLNGGTLVLYPERYLDLDVLNGEIVRREINTLWLTAGVFEQWSEHLPPYDGLQYVMSGGDIVSPRAVERVYRAWPHTQVINGYGPTENTTFTTCHLIPHDSDFARPVSVGKAINGTSLHVLGDGRKPLPLGAVGELYVGGDGVARGYWNRPELTAETFIDGLYKTGDLVRRLPDGTLDFIGRADDQVKVRGFRIELGEIEAQLRRQPEVKEAVVVARREGTGKRLVAYVVPAQPAADLADTLTRALGQELPDYMVPAAFVMMEAFPLNPNGKIDRKALPEPDWQATSSYTAPRTAVEAQLAAIWAQLLKLDRVGVDDNFFAIGGDSILSIQAVSRANLAGIAITTRQLFENQTIAALAAQARHGVRQETPQEAVTGGLSLLPIQRQFLGEDEVERHHFNQSLLLETPEGFDARFLREVVAVLLNRHDALRLRFIGSGAEHQELIDEMIAASAIVEPALADVTARCTHWQQSFDLAKGPLFRAVYFESGRLFLVAHHIVVDGVSWRILLADIEQAFGQYQAGEPVVLAPKTSSFQQWGTALAEYAETLTERAYWLSQPETAPLPVDHVVERPTYSSSRRARVRLQADETQALLQKCAPVYRTTINELLLSGLYLGMRRWTKAADLRIALEGHGRESLFEQLDTTQTVGWFTTMYPLTLHSESANVAEVIKSVKEQYRALPNGGIGYGLLRYVVGDEAIAAQELPQLVFNYLGQFDQSVNRDTALRAAAEPMGPATSGDRRRPYRLGLNGGVSNGALDLALDYSALEYDDATIAALATHIERGLRDVIEHCLATERGDFTPSDFPLATVSQARLDAWQRAYPGLTRIYPATGMQQGMYFHSLLDRRAYVTQIYPVFHGDLSTEHFREAWRTVINRHDIFRTAFVAQEERLHQLVVAHVDLPWHEYDWREVPAAEQRARFAEWLEKDKAAGFDFAKAPLQRISLFRMAGDRWQLLWTHHHMLLDGWCAPLVYKEVMHAYECLTRGEPVHLPDAPVYEGYIQWLQRRDATEARQYWRETLKDVEAPTPLVVDKLPKDGRIGFQEQTLELGADETARLEAFARAHHTTPNTLMQLAWGYLLHRYSGEPQVTFGAITSGRPAEVAGIEKMIGLFINTIPVKVVFEPGARTASLLGELHRAFQHGQEHSYLPLAEIQKQSALSAGVPLFDSLLAFENYPLDTEMAADTRSRTSNLRVESSAIDERTNYKLTLIVTLAGRLKVRCGYMAEVFAHDTVARLLGHLARILEALRAEARIEDVDPVTVQERETFTQWNDTAAEIPADTCIHQLFVERMLVQPYAVALRDADGAMSYEDLFRRALMVCRALQAMKVRPEELVGVRLPKGRGQVIATLGIMMAGAAYLPMEVSWPDERCKAIRELSNCRFVFDNGIDLSSMEPAVGDLASLAAGLSYEGLADKLAYVIFTSGSTGTPKGVAIEHAAAVNTIIDINRRYDVGAADRVLAVSALSFDLSVYDIFGLLSVGGEVVFPAPNKATDPRHWAELVERHDITLWDTVPASADLLAQHFETEGRVCDAPLRSIWMSGDWIHPALPKRLWHVFPEARVHSMGGATEASIWSIHYPVTHDTSRLKSVPYGKPMANQSFHILDRKLRQVPVGVIGELFIGGRGVARCYYGDEERTAKSFLHHDGLGERLYRTGDMGRYFPDGNIEFIGRIDHQVKIRGFRIELGEIEALLSQHQAVKEALVEVKGTGNDKYLAAYVVPAAGHALDEAALVASFKESAGAALPSYMLPAAYVILESFPLTANGKVNKKALPEPGKRSLAEYVAPSTETERTLAAIWRELLGSDREIGVTENFFEAGGNSLLAMQILYRVEDRLACRLDIADVFSYQSIQLLARFIDAITLEEFVSDDNAGQESFDELQY